MTYNLSIAWGKSDCGVFVKHFHIDAALADALAKTNIFHLNIAPIFIGYLSVMCLFLLHCWRTRWSLSGGIVLIRTLDKLFLRRAVNLLVAFVVLEDLLWCVCGRLWGFYRWFVFWPLTTSLGIEWYVLSGVICLLCRLSSVIRIDRALWCFFKVFCTSFFVDFCELHFVLIVESKLSLLNLRDELKYPIHFVKL